MSEGGPRRWLVATLAFLAAAGLVCLVYGNALEGPFILDDVLNIRNNDHILITELTPAALWRAATASPLPTRALPNLSFGLNFYASGFDFLGFHLVNLGFHLLSAGLLYGLVLVTLRLRPRPDASPRPELVAGFAALLWAVHPLHTQTVSYIVQRMNGMAAAFSLLCLLLFAHARCNARPGQRRWLFAGSAIAALCALGSKETAATLPFLVILYEWYFFRDLSRAWLVRGAVATAVAALAAIAFAVFRPETTYGVSGLYAIRDFSMAERLLTEPRVVMHYLSLLLYPHPERLMLLYDYPLSRSLTAPQTTWFAMAANIAMLALAAASARRERLLSYAILWWFGNLVIESSFIGLEIVFEHRTYLPSAFVVAALVDLLFRWIRPVVLPTALCSGLVLVAGLWTHERNRVWADDVVCYQDNLRKTPGNERVRQALVWALTERGRVLISIGEHSQALSVLKQAVALGPEYGQAHHHLGWALSELGQHAQAESQYRLALVGDAKDPMIRMRLGLALEAQGKLKEALEAYSQAGQLVPRWPDPLLGIGRVLLGLGRPRDAETALRRGLSLQPGSATMQRALAQAQAAQR